MASGKVIGDVVQYRLDTPIASGAFSTVWQCTELSSGRTYAVKIVDRKVALRNKMTEAIIREVNALEIAGSSPYVTRLVDKMVSKHNYYIIMDLVEGGTLLDLIREQRQELRQLQTSPFLGGTQANTIQAPTTPFMLYDRVQRYFKQLLLALSTLHDHNIVHRDVKPENILLNKRRTRLVLSDFGFACHCMAGVQLHRACGTLKYCAPELLCEHPAYDGRKVDVWAAGITLYMMLFGGFPYRCSHGDPDALLEAIETTKYRIPRPIPSCIEDILGRMLCVDAAQRWSVRQLLQHPWMSGLDLRCNSARAFAHGATTSLAVSASDTAGEATEMISEGCPPVDALPSDEDNIDDGFYGGSEHGQLSSSVSSEPSRSLTSTKRPQRQSANADSGLSLREDPSLPVSFPASFLFRSDSAVHNDRELETPSASKDIVLNTLPDQHLCTSTKEEILQHGTTLVRLTTIESTAVSDDDTTEEREEEDDNGSENESCDWDEVREDAAPEDQVRDTTMWCGLFTRVSQVSYVQDGRLWARYFYGLWLTVYMIFHLVAFVTVCVVAVALRAFLNRDIVDLPLPEVIRRYLSYLLATPLLRLRSHLSATTPTRFWPFGRPSSLSPAELLHRDGHNGSSPHRSLMASSIPGSGLRRYVRVADTLLRDSFVGSAVMSHNASLVSLSHRKVAQPCPKELLESPPPSSMPAAVSIPTLASTESSVNPQSVEKRGSEAVDACAESTEQSSLSLPPTRGMWRRYGHHLRSEAGCVKEDQDERINPRERVLSGGKGCNAQLQRLPLISPSHILETTAALTNAHSLANEEIPLVGEGRNRDSQQGATDDTGSTDSVLDKSAQSSRKNLMFSPVATMHTVPGDIQHSFEDFPIVAKVNDA
ncbi:hypothetical protein JKF63_03624 [Porcisia hertigi]|uniref:Protein kinase domain-containing protein n=1 Tax=Porcisia hertigi TaxID=2761500 RepID=A0A836IQE9_9TRYP|nr:hypothetical protein JKF63_03624 [Porcisia hertigi]